GPDLSGIGKLRPREDLLESILEPSRRIEPQYATYVARTADGRVLTGLLGKRDASAVVLRDGQHKEVTLAANIVEELRPSRPPLNPLLRFAVEFRSWPPSLSGTEAGRRSR